MRRRDSRSWRLCSGTSPAIMRPRRARYLLAMLLAFAVRSADARWYQVEVVVFEQPPSAADGGEAWPELVVRPDFGGATLLQDEPSSESGAPGLASAVSAAVPFALLEPAERRLAGVARRVDGGGYRLLVATGWRQPGYGTAQPRRVYVSDGPGPAAVTLPLPEAPVALPGAVLPATPPRVEGTVAIKVARLLHVELDLVYDHEGVPVRLQETRRVKLRELHYFDHPLVGVIVQVTPYTLPEVAETGMVGADEPEDPEAVEGAQPLLAPAAPP
jgi:hypothetical protein